MGHKRIFRPWNNGLGDHWATMNHLMWKAVTQRQKQLLSVLALPDDQRERMREIRSLLEADLLVELTLETPNEDLDGFALWASLYWPIKRHQWTFDPSLSIIAYCFDSASTPEQKNPSQIEAEMMLAWADSKGLPAVKVGAHLGLQRTVEVLQKSVLFVTVDSGCSHVAHSIGVPTYIYQKDLHVVTCHRHKPYVLCENADRFIAQAENYLSFVKSTRK